MPSISVVHATRSLDELHPSGLSPKVILILSTTLGGVTFLVIIMAIIHCVRRRKKAAKPTPQESEPTVQAPPASARPTLPNIRIDTNLPPATPYRYTPIAISNGYVFPARPAATASYPIQNHPWTPSRTTSPEHQIYSSPDSLHLSPVGPCSNFHGNGASLGQPGSRRQSIRYPLAMHPPHISNPNFVSAYAEPRRQDPMAQRTTYMR